MFALSAILIGVIGVFYVRRRSARKKAGSAPSGARAEQVVRRRQDDRGAADPDSPDGSSARNVSTMRAALAELWPAERRVHPALREEDVAGPLDLPSIARLGGMYFSDGAPRAADGADSDSPSSTHGSRRRFATSLQRWRRTRRASPDRLTAPAARTRTAPCDPGFSMRASCSVEDLLPRRHARERRAPAPA